MITYLLCIGLALTFAVLLLLYRTQVLLNVAQGKYKITSRVDGANSWHGVLFFVFMVLFFVGIFVGQEVYKKHYLPEAASVHGVDTDFMFWFCMGLIMVAFIITNVLLFTFPWIYRYKEGRKALFYPDNHLVEMVWTIVPAVVLAGLLFWGLKVWTTITAPAPPEAQIIEIMGKQFAWQVRYPGKDDKLGKYNFKRIDANNEFGIMVEDKHSEDDFIPRELHLLKGRPIELKIRARDVIHSVFLPHFRVKMDAVPGMQTSFWFTPTMSTDDMRKKLGKSDFNYELACTEVCGRGHFAMRFLVVVDEPAAYKKWLSEQKTWKSQNEAYFAAKKKEVSVSKTTSVEHKEKVASF